MFCLNSLALKGSVEDADESNEGDEKEPPPKNQENLEYLSNGIWSWLKYIIKDTTKTTEMCNDKNSSIIKNNSNNDNNNKNNNVN